MSAPPYPEANLLRSMISDLRGEGRKVIAVQYPGAEPGDEFDSYATRSGRVGVVITERR